MTASIKRIFHFHFPGNQAKGTFIEATVVSQTNPPRALAYSGADLWGDSGKVFSTTYYILDKRNSTYAVSGNQVVTTGSRIYKPDIVQWNDTIEKKKGHPYFLYYRGAIRFA